MRVKTLYGSAETFRTLALTLTLEYVWAERPPPYSSALLLVTNTHSLKSECTSRC